MSSFEDRAARYVTDLIRDFKLEDFQAAGFPGNFGVETRGFEHVQEINPIGGGRGGLGDAQWTGPRRRTFEAWLARNPQWTARDYDANYSMLFRELEGEESAALEAVRHALNVDEATEIVMRRYERPGVEHLERRKEYGRRALVAFKAKGLDVATLKAQGRPGGITIAPVQTGERPPISTLPALKTNFDIQALLPLILGVLTMLQNRQQQATGKTPDIMELLTAILQQGLQPVKPVEPPPKPAVSVAPTPTSLLVGGGTFLAGLIAQLNGNIAPPVGETATLPGILTTVLPIAATFLGGPLGGLVSRLFSGFSITRKTS